MSEAVGRRREAGVELRLIDDLVPGIFEVTGREISDDDERGLRIGICDLDESLDEARR